MLGDLGLEDKTLAYSSHVFQLAWPVLLTSRRCCQSPRESLVCCCWFRSATGWSLVLLATDDWGGCECAASSCVLRRWARASQLRGLRWFPGTEKEEYDYIRDHRKGEYYSEGTCNVTSWSAHGRSWIDIGFLESANVFCNFSTVIPTRLASSSFVGTRPSWMHDLRAALIVFKSA